MPRASGLHLNNGSHAVSQPVDAIRSRDCWQTIFSVARLHLFTETGCVVANPFIHEIQQLDLIGSYQRRVQCLVGKL